MNNMFSSIHESSNLRDTRFNENKRKNRINRDFANYCKEKL